MDGQAGRQDRQTDRQTDLPIIRSGVGCASKNQYSVSYPTVIVKCSLYFALVSQVHAATHSFVHVFMGGGVGDANYL